MYIIHENYKINMLHHIHVEMTESTLYLLSKLMFYAITEKYPPKSFCNLFILMWAYFHYKLIAFLCKHAQMFAPNFINSYVLVQIDKKSWQNAKFFLQNFIVQSPLRWVTYTSSCYTQIITILRLYLNFKMLKNELFFFFFFFFLFPKGLFTIWYCLYIDLKKKNLTEKW